MTDPMSSERVTELSNVTDVSNIAIQPVANEIEFAAISDDESATESETDPSRSKAVSKIRIRSRPQPDSPSTLNSKRESDDLTRSGLHAKTTSIYIWNLVRPLVIREMKDHISKCAGAEAITVWFDRIRSHCFATFPSVEAAQRAQEALDNRVFPSEDHSRKPMRVNYIPTESVSRWISIEERDGPRSTTRWCVVYGINEAGETTASLETWADSAAKPSRQQSNLERDKQPVAHEEAVFHTPIEKPFRRLSDAEISLRESTLRLKLQSSMMKNKANREKAQTPTKLQRTKTEPRMFYSEAPPHVIAERLKNR